MTGYRTYAVALAWIITGVATLAGATIDEDTRHQITMHMEAVIGGIAFLAGLLTALMRRITATPPARIGLSAALDRLIDRILESRGLPALFAILIAAPLIGGCANWQTMEATAARQGADAADTVLRNALWSSCQAVSIGAVRRWVGSNEELAQAYDLVCRERPSIMPIVPAK